MVTNRNWKKYNPLLVNRGRVINIYVSANLCKENDLRKLNKKKFGRPYEYTNTIILAAYSLKCLFRFGYRQTGGLIKDISNFIKGCVVPDFRTIWWRIKKMGSQNFRITKKISGKGDIDVTIDSTGLKSTSAGEYMTYRYDKVKDWIKFHLVAGVESLDILNVRVTKSRFHDSRKLVEMVDPIVGNVSCVYGDGAYDTNKIFEYTHSKGIYPNIPVHITASKHCSKSRRRAVIEQLGLHGERGTRDIIGNYTKEYRKSNQEKWRKTKHHGRRWAVETVISSFKQMFGESVSAKKFNMIERELNMKVILYNQFHR